MMELLQEILHNKLLMQSKTPLLNNKLKVLIQLLMLLQALLMLQTQFHKLKTKFRQYSYLFKMLLIKSLIFKLMEIQIHKMLILKMFKINCNKKLIKLSQQVKLMMFKNQPILFQLYKLIKVLILLQLIQNHLQILNLFLVDKSLTS